MRKIAVAALTLALLAPASAVWAVEQPRISDISPIKLRSGPNTVPHFAPDGRDALIVLGWRDNGNAHGYDLYLVLMPASAAKPEWNVVGVDPGGNGRFQDIVTDDPHLGEDAVRSIRFARAKVDGRPATVLFVATRDTGTAPIPDPAPVTFEVYRLAHNDGEVGYTVDYFTKIQEIKSTGKYCNAEMALRQQFGIPLTASYNGPQTAEGC